jgi:hypothetical protein
MGFVPMHFSAMDSPIWKADERYPFEFTPPSSAKECFEPPLLANGKAYGYRLDVVDLAKDLKIRHSLQGKAEARAGRGFYECRALVSSKSHVKLPIRTLRKRGRLGADL